MEDIEKAIRATSRARSRLEFVKARLGGIAASIKKLEEEARVASKEVGDMLSELQNKQREVRENHERNSTA